MPIYNLTLYPISFLRSLRLAVGFLFISQQAMAVTTTTRYTYNNDAALTQITTQVDQQAPTIQYLSWDNLVRTQAPALFRQVTALLTATAQVRLFPALITGFNSTCWIG